MTDAPTDANAEPITDTVDADTAPAVEAERVEPVDVETDNPNSTPEETKLRISGKKYRDRIKSLEAEHLDVTARLGTAEGSVGTLQAQIIEGLLPANLKPAALWASGAKVADMIDGETGRVDPLLVASAALTAGKLLGIARFSSIPANPRLLAETPRTDADWASFLQQKK